MQNKLDLKKLFDDSLCSFEISKRAKESGMTCANTFYAYDEHGEVTDGAWMAEGGQGDTKNLLDSLPNFKPPILYPAINIAMALGLLEDCSLDFKKIDCYEFNGKYFFKHKEGLFQSEKLVDLFIEVWIVHKKK